MAAPAATAPPIRSALLRDFASGDLFGFLNAAQGYLRSNDDREIRVAAARAYAALGLQRAASRVAAPDAPASATAELVPWSRTDDHFRAGLAALDRRTGLGAAIVDVWRRFRPHLELCRSTEGSYQVFSRHPDCPGWLPSLAPHAHATNSDAAQLRKQWEGQIIRTLGVVGLGLGYVPRAVLRASQRTFLDFSAPIILIERSLLAWAVALHLADDWAALLADERVRICAGPDAAAILDQELAASDRRSPVLLPGGPPWPGAIPETHIAAQVAAAEARQSTQQDALLERVCAAAESRDADAWARRFDEALQRRQPLTIVGVTSRYTTVLQHTLRELLDAFARAGHDTHLYLEPSDHSHFMPVQLLELFERVRPDLIVQIDHLRYTQPRAFPAAVPGICWIQDRLAHLFQRQAGQAVSPREFVFAVSATELIAEFDYPAQRTTGCAVPTNPGALLDPHETTEQLAPYRCDVMYATHAPPFDSPEHRFRYVRDGLEGLGRRILETAYDTLRAAISRPGFSGEYDPAQHLTRAEHAVGLAFSDPGGRAAIVQLLRDIIDQTLREAAIRAVAAWADATGRRFHLYGRGWERRPEFARFARGPVAPGVELGRAFRAARICLHTGCNHALHQRVLDGLSAGGFFLFREMLYESRPDVFRAMYEHIRQLRPPFPYLLKPEVLPASVAARCRELFTAFGLPPDDGLRIDAIWWLSLRSQCELGWTQTAAQLWPRYPDVTFRDEAQLPDRLEHFLRHEDERVSIAAEMRAAIRGEFTYDALAARMLRTVRDGLARDAGASRAP